MDVLSLAPAIADTFLTTTVPVVVNIVVPAVLTVVVVQFGRVYKAITGKEMEKRDREALHSALESGALATIDLVGKSRQDAIIQIAKASVPDAIRNLNPSAETLEALAAAKIVKEGLANIKGLAG